jgi:RNA polymerase sigma-70 factor (ECF subfamily)
MSDNGSMARLTVVSGRGTQAQRFEALVRPHYEVLYRAAYRLTRSVHDAEDLVQELCVRAYGRLEDLAEKENPRAWLLCVLQRLFIDQTRRYDRKHVSSIETVAHDAFAHDGPGPAEEAEADAARRQLDSAWRRLEKDQRVLLALHDVEGYSLAEITAITGLKEGTIKSRLHRARVKLGRLFRHEEGALRAALARRRS